MKKERRKISRGFTLIEMIVVVAVIAILMSASTEIFSNMYTVSNKTNDSRVVLEEARYALDTITRESRDAESLIPTSNYGDPGTIEIKAKEAKTILFDCSDCNEASTSGRIRMTTTNFNGTEDPVKFLTSDKVEVIQFYIMPIEMASEDSGLNRGGVYHPFFTLRIKVRGKTMDRTGNKPIVTLATSITRSIYPDFTYCELFNCIDVQPKVVGTQNTSYALRSDGKVLTWGQKPDGSFTTTPIFAKDTGGADELKNVIDIDASSNTVVALKADGTVISWGSPPLGDGTSNANAYPVRVVGSGGSGVLSDIVDIAAGGAVNLALKSDGTVWSWGTGGFVGDGTDTARYSPVQVKGLNNVGFLSGIKAIAASDDHALVLTTNGTVYSWGDNGYGQLGTGTYGSSTRKNYPVQVANAAAGTNIREIASGYSFSLSLSNDGYVRSWGLSNYGQCGYGSDILRVTPGTVSNLDNTGNVSVSAKGAYALSLKTSGVVWGWGYNAYGNIGDNSTSNRLSPVQQGFYDNFSYIFAGSSSHSLALTASGNVYAWGNNQYGQIGNGATGFSQQIPVQVQGVGGVGYLDLTP